MTATTAGWAGYVSSAGDTTSMLSARSGLTLWPQTGSHWREADSLQWAPGEQARDHVAASCACPSPRTIKKVLPPAPKEPHPPLLSRVSRRGKAPFPALGWEEVGNRQPRPQSAGPSRGPILKEPGEINMVVSFMIWLGLGTGLRTVLAASGQSGLRVADSHPPHGIHLQGIPGLVPKHSMARSEGTGSSRPRPRPHTGSPGEQTWARLVCICPKIVESTVQEKNIPLIRRILLGWVAGGLKVNPEGCLSQGEAQSPRFPFPSKPD